MTLEEYLRDYFGVKNSAKDMFYGYQGPGSNSSYAGYTYGNSYGGGTNGSSYAGWTASNPLSGNNAFSGNQGSSGFGGTQGYDPRMGMKDHGSHNAGGGGGWNLSAPMQVVGGGSGGNYGTGTSYQGISPVGAGGAQKFGGGRFDDLIAARQTQQGGMLLGDRGLDYHSSFAPGLPPNNNPTMNDSTVPRRADPPQGGARQDASKWDNLWGPQFDNADKQPQFDPSKPTIQPFGMQVPFVSGAAQQIYPPQYQPQYQPGRYYPDPIQSGQVDAQMQGDYRDMQYDPPGSIFDGGGGE